MEAKDNSTEQNDEKIVFSKKETCLSMEENDLSDKDNDLSVKKNDSSVLKNEIGQEETDQEAWFKEWVTDLSRDKMDLIGGEKSFS